MKKLILIIVLVLITLISIHFITNYKIINLELTSNEATAKLRDQYANYLANSPFKKTLKLTKSQRKDIQLPPNKYYEREWELTMNPDTGEPEPNKVLELQKRLLDKSVVARAPGDAVSNNWVDRGPNNVGGRTRVVLFDPNDSTNKRVFAGGVSGGLWVNQDITNVSSSWAQVSDVPSNMNISCITVDPNDSQIWYIGTGEQNTFGAAVGNGVYKTINGGVSWINVTVQLAGGDTSGTDFAGLFFINDIIAWNHVNWDGLEHDRTELFIGVGTQVYGDAANPTNLLGLQNAGLYKSTDNGINWNRIESASLELSTGSSNYTIPNDFEISGDNKTLWMGTIKTPGTSSGGGKVFNSTDGITWNLVTELAKSNRVELALSSNKLNPNKMYALTEGDGTDPHIYATLDAFATITELAKPDDVDIDIPSNDFTRGQAYYDLVIEVDPNNDNIVYVGGIDLFRTDQGIDTDVVSEWKQISKWSNNNNLKKLKCSVVHADQHAFTFMPGDSNKAVIGCDGGVYYASNLSEAETSNVFSTMNKDYNVTQFYYGGYGQSTSNELILAGAQDNGSQFMNGALAGANSSLMVYGGDGAYSTIDKDGNYMISSYLYGNHYYYSLPYSGAFYTIDNNNGVGDFINQAGLDHNLNIMYSNGSSTSKKINRYILGVSSATKTQLTNVLLNGSPTAFKVSPYTTTNTTLLVGTDDGKLLKLTNANSTPIWENISGDLFVGSVSAVEFGKTENDILVTFHNYGVTSIWHTSNGGITWENKEGNLPDMPVKCILQNPLLTDEVIVGTELGVWGTRNFDNASPTWIQSNNGMRDVKVVDLDLRTGDNSILATTHGRGVFTGKFTNTEFTISAKNSTVAECTPNNAVFNFNFNTTETYNTVTTFTQIGAPPSASINFSSNSLNTEGAFTLTIGNIDAVATGEYPITVTGTGNEANSIDVILKVVDANFGVLTTTSPINEVTGIVISNANFTWNIDTNATSYDIDIASDAGFNTIIETKNVAANSYTNSSILNKGTVYYWRIRPKNSCYTGSYSEIQKFQTQHDCMLAGNNNSVLIPDSFNNTEGVEATSTINITDNLTITDVNISLNISHTWTGDLVISLISPNNIETILFNRGCDSFRSQGINITYDDSASKAIVCSSPTIGSYIPSIPLSTFNGENSIGDWTLKVIDYYSGDIGTINNWSIEICQDQIVVNSSLTNNPITVGTNSIHILNKTETEAISVGSLANEQVFMLAELPIIGEVRLNNSALVIGDTFTQDDINTNKITYVNTSSVTTSDSFKVDITNATGGFLPNQQVNITIDAALGVDDDFFIKTGISIFPTVSDGNFSISSKTFLGKTTIELYTIIGQKVFSDQLYFKNGNIEFINANHLVSGVYILRLTSETSQGSKKIIIK